MKQTKYFLCVAFLVSYSIFSQEKKQGDYVFSLQEAITHALTHNYTAINADRDIESARQKKWETTASGLPQINGTVDFMDNIQIQRSGLPASAFGQPGASPDDIIPVGFGVKYNAIAKLTLQQLIFDGSYIVGLQAAKTFLQYSENAKLKTQADLKEMVINTYGNVLLTEQSLLILEKNKSVLEQNYNEMSEIYKNGLTEEENVEQLAITLASVKSSVEYTKKIKTVAYQMLKVALGLELNDRLKLTDNLETLTKANISVSSTKETLDLSSTVNYKMAENNQDTQRLLLKLERSRQLPSLGAFANFGYNSFGNQFNFVSSNQKWYDFSAIGFSLNVPIFSSFKSGARIQQAKIEYDKSIDLLTETAKQVQLAWEKAKNDYEYSIEQYTTTKQTLVLAERIESKQLIKFKEGISSSFEYTQAQRQLYTEQQNHIKSMLDVITKKAVLEKITE